MADVPRFKCAAPADATRAEISEPSLLDPIARATCEPPRSPAGSPYRHRPPQPQRRRDHPRQHPVGRRTTSPPCSRRLSSSRSPTRSSSSSTPACTSPTSSASPTPADPPRAPRHLPPAQRATPHSSTPHRPTGRRPGPRRGWPDPARCRLNDSRFPFRPPLRGRGNGNRPVPGEPPTPAITCPSTSVLAGPSLYAALPNVRIGRRSLGRSAGRPESWSSTAIYRKWVMENGKAKTGPVPVVRPSKPRAMGVGLLAQPAGLMLK